MKALTGRQREVLSFITEYLKTNSFPPTVREIGEHFDISLRAVHDHLSALQKKGYISQRSKCSRSMKILKYADAKDDVIYSAKIPVIGNLVHGLPVLSEENYDGCIGVSEPFINKELSYFALKIADSDMAGAGICKGDTAIVKSCEEASEGQIVAVIKGSSIILRKYSVEANRICLKAECEGIPPVYCQDVRIVGTLSCIIRSY